MSQTDDLSWHEVSKRISALTESESDTIANMATIACELFHGFERFHWVGFLQKHRNPYSEDRPLSGRARMFDYTV